MTDVLVHEHDRSGTWCLTCDQPILTAKVSTSLAAYLAADAEAFSGKNQVNYDRLLELGVIDFDKVVNHLFKERRRSSSRKFITGPEGRLTRANRWYPSARENADHVYAEPAPGERAPIPESPWQHHIVCISREHIAHLVTRCLQGKDVPPDVQQTVDCCGWQPEKLIYRYAQAPRGSGWLQTLAFATLLNDARP